MRLFHTIAGLRCYLDLHRPGPSRLWDGVTYESSPIGMVPEVGLVPTMGALHNGHLRLIQRARRENKVVVVSIFVNPLQFGPKEDFQKYPRTLEADCQLCEAAGVDAVFAPSAEELGVIHQGTIVNPPKEMISGLCGRSRIGHFEGVATIVTKLLNIVQPNRAYFGQKDAQQLAMIQQLVNDLNFAVEIVGCPTVREPSGLAQSSRNQYLSGSQKEQAAILYRSLQRAEQAFRQGTKETETLIHLVKSELATVPEIELEYAELVDPKTLAPLETVDESGLLAIAARLDSTRLIDNIVLQKRLPIVAIDGPAGAGKSTVARQVAQVLNLLYLDTGAMYRALTWLVMQSDIPVTDEPGVAELVSQAEIIVGGSVDATQVTINGREVTSEIRGLDVTANVSAIAAQPAVRKELVNQQRRYGQTGGVVIEGRDIGTNVFPDAEVKIYLTASVQERARRRQLDLKNQGKGDISLDELEQSIYERDRKDSTRALAPLRKAVDAIEIQTDGLTIDQVVEQIVQRYHEVA
ncbi:MAG TPA: bifunctional pantoate--beta-alanine ligase/(d)CMP kinase [Leptolyngbyaceae cyanobacterium M33_DOE_097]|uniref:Bifunctional pantoate ligase/cytidylate kinase n=1 Tax=Oscillatoriales cyanobacterium SpSt-418 TaxID=2282169 RepID=A0A7C3KHB9_9CYAN|nr:bifunctional pantoate--beta-alanine ligase/(d)CMP kinase [Leptolyngbyaceae cyanobacterium M33_DOE_097]